MKTSEFRRWLQSRGVVMKEGSNHTKLYHQGKQSTMPRNAAEMKEGTRKAILKQLGIKDPPR